MLTRTIRTIAAVAMSISLAGAVVPSISQADTAKSTATTGRPNFDVFTITKGIDAASPSLL